jgi:hypothetical protein
MPTVKKKYLFSLSAGPLCITDYDRRIGDNSTLFELISAVSLSYGDVTTTGVGIAVTFVQLPVSSTTI